MDIRTLVKPFWQQKPVQVTTRLHSSSSSSKITTNLSLISSNFDIDIPNDLNLCLYLLYSIGLFARVLFSSFFFVLFLTYPIIKTFINCSCPLPSLPPTEVYLQPACLLPSLISSRFFTLSDLNMYYMIIGEKLDGSADKICTEKIISNNVLLAIRFKTIIMESHPSSSTLLTSSTLISQGAEAASLL